MSELKAYRIKGVTLGDFHDVYLKSEADKVIARNKYKRCLANANVCAEKLYRQNLTIYGYEFYCKWLKRWFSIAEKFKEAK